MLRIWFTAEDLCRVQVAPSFDPLWEIVLSRVRISDRVAAPCFRALFAEFRRDRKRVALAAPGARLLSTLAPMGPYFPDFLTPPEAVDGLPAGLDAIRATPRHRLCAELTRLDRQAALPDWVRPLADGASSALAHLSETLTDFHRAVLEPVAGAVEASVNADRAQRATDLLTGGVNGLLAGMSPLMRWRHPVLEIDYCVDRDLHLGGRGLRLVPSYFCQGKPISLADPNLTPVLVYPVADQYRWTHLPRPRHQSLAALMGAGRASALEMIDSGISTTGLATRMRMSAASASRHAAILRDAGLVTSLRVGPAVLHTRTPLGESLLQSGPAE